MVLNSGIHRVQDYIVSNLARGMSISELANFGKRSGWKTARVMLNDPDVTLQTVAERAGFRNPRHFRRAWKQAFGVTPSSARGSIAAGGS